MARRSAKEAKAASEESAKAAASAHEMFKTVVEVRTYPVCPPTRNPYHPLTLPNSTQTKPLTALHPTNTVCYLQQERTKLLALNDRVLSELKSNKKSAEDTKQKLKATEETVGAMQNLNKRFIDELHKARDEAKTNAKSAAEVNLFVFAYVREIRLTSCFVSLTVRDATRACCQRLGGNVRAQRDATRAEQAPNLRSEGCARRVRQV